MFHILLLKFFIGLVLEREDNNLLSLITSLKNKFILKIINNEQFLLAIRLHSQWEKVWVPIKGYPKHEISSTERISNIKTKRILKQRTNNCYRQICVSNNGESKKLTVPRLVCSAFHFTLTANRALIILIPRRLTITFKT